MLPLVRFPNQLTTHSVLVLLAFLINWPCIPILFCSHSDTILFAFQYYSVRFPDQLATHLDNLLFAFLIN